MSYAWTAIPDSRIPKADNPLFQHLLDTYVSESNKVASTWKHFTDVDLLYKPHPRSSAVGDILRHQLLSERRFFGEFLGTPEPAPDKVLPEPFTIESANSRLIELVLPRLDFFAVRPQSWWLETVPFFDVERQRIWIFWRRILHTVAFDVVKMDLTMASAAQGVQALVVIVAATQGYFTSMNQALIGAMAGAGLARGRETVQRKQIIGILRGWAIGPLSGLALAFALEWLARLLMR